MRTTQIKKSGKRTQSTRQLIPNQVYATSYPREMKVRLDYSELINITLTGSVAYDYLFNLNSIHDPNRSGTGHQPQGHDQWNQLYGRYRVDRVTVKLTPLGSNPTTTNQMYTIFPSNSATGLTAYGTAAEMPFAKTTVSSNAGTTVPITASYDLATITGIRRNAYQSDKDYEASFGNSPSEILTLHVVLEDAAFSNPSCYFNIEMHFFCTLFDSLQLGQS